MRSESLLIIFVKNPEKGKVKTRLAATIGDDKALAIYNRLMEKTQSEASKVNVDKRVFYNEFPADNDLWSANGFEKDVQAKGDLGLKMLSAFEKAFSMGYKKVCIIGSDCYDLHSEILTQAFDALNENEAIIGPAKDGGYYLLGMKKLLPELFQNKQWSTETVCSSTIQDFENGNITYKTLPVLSDIDREEDLGDWASDLL